MSVKVTGVDAVVRDLQKLSAAKLIRPPMMTAVKLLQDDMGENKPKRAGAFTALASPGQKRAYWAKIAKNPERHRDGIGYVRTHFTRRAWHSKVERTGNGYKGTVGNNQPAARWVYGIEQQDFHTVTGFPRADKQMIKRRDDIIRFFERHVADIVRKMGA